jgi:hypothetical protein
MTRGERVIAVSDTARRYILDHYPRGMALLKKIRGTFRSVTGRRYGPQFIDLGIAIGEELYRIIRTDFANQDE